jgi:hypothetical protein
VEKAAAEIGGLMTFYANYSCLPKTWENKTMAPITPPKMTYIGHCNGSCGINPEGQRKTWSGYK